MTGVWILVIALAAATAFGLWRRWSDGRMSDAPVPVGADEPEAHVDTPDARHHGGELLTSQELGAALGEKATFVQFSSAFCQPCRSTRLLLGGIVAELPGVAHVEIDAEEHMDLVRRLEIRRTPTVLLLDADGAIRKRATGLPRKSEVLAALGQVV